MSHQATNWAFQQRGLKPSAKILLLVLADCHNPAHGCYPTQAFLAESCEMNRDTVNVHLSQLEERGLIRRVRSVDPNTKRQRPTRYKLAFESDFDAPVGGGNPVSENPTRTPKAVSEIPTDPCRKNPESRVGNSDTNPVKEHGKNARAREAGKLGASEPRQFDHLKPSAPPRAGRAEKPAAPGGEQIAKPEAERRVANFWAGILKAGSFVAPNAISLSVARRMLMDGLVSRAELTRVGVRV